MCNAIKLVNSQDYHSIKFDVKGSSLDTCTILGLYENLVETMRSKQISNGLQIKPNLRINNAKSIDLNSEELINIAKMHRSYHKYHQFQIM